MDHIVGKFRSDEARRTKAGRLLSDFFVDNLHAVPFETAASIAAQLGISAMTVTRYLRDLGYSGLDALKAELRLGPISSAWDITENMEDLSRDLRDGRLLADMVSQQIEALHSLNKLTHTPEWQAAVEMLTDAKSVFVAGYQNISGIVRYFSEQMAYVRDGVRYMDGLNGTYLELLEKGGDGRILVLVDCRRFASKSRLLAQAAKEAGIRILIVTDSHCDWAEHGSVTLSIPAMRWRTWDSFMPLAALLDLLVTSAVIAQGESVVKRGRLINALQDRFGDFERR
ncbi:MAG TPA: MurR/RpiR family transcriptional regulator [Candidatus Sulfotelmatobacter sp.]|nr:MurR/RpiR family transcriptional regulator [Candidatus Sulfotelmatobacter sp.]